MRILAYLLCLLPAVASAQTLSQGERDRAMSELHATRKQFLDATAGLNAAQWKFKPSPAAWSIAEIAEHIVATEDLLFNMVTGKIMATPAQPEKKDEVKGKDETVLEIIADRSKKAQAPESIQPKGRFASPAEAAQAFRASRDRTIAYVETTRDDLRSHFAPHPATGLIDAYQWILLMAAHAGRHVAQMEEVKAAAGYPR